jgi:hypothetical protein
MLPLYRQSDSNFIKKKTIPDIWKSIAFWYVPRLWPVLVLVKAACSWKLVWSIGGILLTGETECGALVQCYWQGKLSVEYWWNVTDRGNWVWSIGGMLLTGETECGALVECYWQGKLSAEHWWNITDRGNWVWNIGEMLLTGETECGALVECYWQR